MSFNERRLLMIKITTYLLTLKIVSSGRMEVVIVRIILLSMLRQHLRKLFWANAAGPTFSTTVCILRSSVMYRLPFRLRKVSSEVWQHTHSDDVGIGRQHAHWHQSEPADVASVHTLAAALDRATMQFFRSTLWFVSITEQKLRHSRLLLWSVQRVQSYGGSNFGLLHRNALSPIWRSV